MLFEGVRLFAGSRLIENLTKLSWVALIRLPASLRHRSQQTILARRSPPL
jgi:hypothetical protein